jgi:protease PrsW
MSQEWNYQPSQQAPPPPPPPVADGTKGLGCMIAGLGCGGTAVFFLALLIGLLFVAELGISLLIVAALMAFIPAIIYTSMVLLIDRFDPEPPWLLFLAFLWGAVISIFGALIINDTSALIVSMIAGPEVADVFATVVFAPISEEAMKGIGLLIVLIALRKEFDGIVDGIVYACMIALGFATVENILYYGRSVGGGGIGSGLVVFFLRGGMSPFAHPLFTSMTGIGCGVAREQKRGPLVVIAPILGYCAAVLLHATWNGIPTLAGMVAGELGLVVFIGAYVVGWIPAFACFIGAIAFCLNRERKIIKEFLQEEVQLGIVTPEEFNTVISPTRRFGFLVRNFQKGGLGGYRNARTFSRAVVRLALSKWHTLNASKKQAETRSLSMIPILRQQLAQLRGSIVP